MDEKLRNLIRITKIVEMKNPVICMHFDDFDSFKTEVESKLQNFNMGENPAFEGIPISRSHEIERGSIVIYDDDIVSWL